MHTRPRRFGRCAGVVQQLVQDAGASGFLTKPVDRDRMLTMVNAVLEERVS